MGNEITTVCSESKVVRRRGVGFEVGSKVGGRFSRFSWNKDGNVASLRRMSYYCFVVLGSMYRILRSSANGFFLVHMMHIVLCI